MHGRPWQRASGMNESKATRYQRVRRRATAAAMVSGRADAGARGLHAGRPLAARRGLAVRGDGLPPVPARGGRPGCLPSARGRGCGSSPSLPAVLYLAVRVDRAYGRDRRPTWKRPGGARLHGTAVRCLPACARGRVVVAGRPRLAGAWWRVAGRCCCRPASWPRSAPGRPVLRRLAAARPVSAPSAGRPSRPDLARTGRVPVAAIDEWGVADAVASGGDGRRCRPHAPCPAGPRIRQGVVRRRNRGRRGARTGASRPWRPVADAGAGCRSCCCWRCWAATS